MKNRGCEQDLQVAALFSLDPPRIRPDPLQVREVVRSVPRAGIVRRMGNGVRQELPGEALEECKR